MKSVCARSSEKFCATALVRLFAASLAVLVLLSLAITPAFGQCTLNGVANPCVLNGPVTITTTYDAPNNTVTNANGVITNNGVATFTSGANNTILDLTASTTLQGGGTVTLAETGAGGVYVEQGAGGVTLTNFDNLIQGAGVIGFGGLALANDSAGVISANSSGQTLFLNGTGGITNQGLMKATNGGILEFDGNTITNTGANLTANGGTVQFNNATVNGGTLNSLNGGSMQTIANGVATLNGVTISSGSTYTSGNNTDLFVSGTLTNNGVLQLTSGANNAILGLNSTTLLTGGGTVTMTEGGGGGVYIQQQAGGITLENVNNLIQGAGVIGNSGLIFQNDAGGTVNANSSGQTLYLNGSGNVTNLGVMKATNGGTLEFDGVTVANAGTSLTANGGTVQFNNAIINGGTLNSLNGGTLQTIANGVATLNVVTLSSGSTYTSGNNTDLFVSGTFTNNGALQLTSAANNTILGLNSSVLLTGGGTVTMTETGAGGVYIEQQAGLITLENVNNLIQGAGVIGNGGLTFQNDAGGTVNANASGQTLFLNGSGNVTNLGLLTATNGGILQFQSVTVANAGTNITANGGAVQFNSAIINGGTLNSLNGGTLQTTANGVATLNGVTLSSGSTYSTGNNTELFVSGTLTNNGAIQLSAAANNTFLGLNSSVLLTGGGTVTMTETGVGGGVYVQQNAGLITLENVNNLIQGAGVIGNGGLFFQNDVGGTVNANSSGLTLLVNGSGGVTNQGLLEATGGGTLQIANTTVNNQGGNISGNGGTVVVNSAVLQGGTLNGTFQTIANGVATLDGTTQGAITLSGGSTYATGNNTDLFTTGTINNNGDIQVTAGANNTFLFLNSNTTLTGNGTVTLAESGGGGLYVSQVAGGTTLDNFSNTIRGAGIIGNGGLSVQNDLGGTILANASGQTLYLNGSGTITNLGTFQVNPGAALVVQNGPFTNFASNTLTGGTYNVYGPSNLEIDQLGSTGGEIVNNAATILLDSPGSNFVDAASKDALSNFSNNTASGSFTIQSGRNFTSPSSFANAGVVNVGTGSTFTTGGTGNYNQSGGSTKVDGALTAGGGHVNINGGTLLGNGGTITGNVSMSGTMSPGDTPTAAGALAIAGNYAQTSAGIFQLDIASLSQFDLLNVTGATTLTGTLNVNMEFVPVVGDTFTFITSGGLVSGTFSTVNGLNIGNGLVLQVLYQANDVQITTLSLAPVNDFWNGGTGNWSNNPQWSLGTSPGINNNAFIYSGGNDLVTLDIGSGSVNQLNVGGASNGFTSELADGGTAQSLTIIQGLSVGANGFLNLTGASTISAATMGNSGHVYVGTGATLTLTSQPNGITDAVAGSQFDLLGTFTAGGVNGFAQLNSIEGAVNLFGQNFTDTPGSSTLTISSTGSLAANAGTKLTIAGIVNNSGTVSTGSGGNILTITGTVTNSGTFQLNGPGDKATMAGLTNSGYVDVQGGSSFQVNGNASNSGQIYTSFSGPGGSTFNVTGTLTNTNFIGLESKDTATIGGAVTNGGSFQLTGGATATFTSSLMNTGTVDLENASLLKINGAADNFGTLSTSANHGTGGNTLTVSGLLTNEATGTVSVNGPTDVLTASAGLVNKGLVTVKNGSTIDPPFVNNLGTINIDATSTFVVGTGTATGPGFIQLANGTFGEMINSATAFGQVNVAGSASLNGTLDILLQPGYNPAVGTSFTYLLLNPGQLSGTYSTILNDIFNGGTEMWMVNYNNAGGFVQLTAATNNPTVPEPGTFLLLGSGLLSLSYGVRRRFKR